MSAGFDSEWFRAANDGTRFELARGRARTRLTTDELAAELYSGGGELVATVRGTINEESGRIACIARLEERAAEELQLYGYFFQRDEETTPELRVDEEVSILLTDGWTTFGIALPAQWGSLTEEGRR